MNRSTWPNPQQDPDGGGSHWILQSDLYLNMMVAFIVLIGGGDILRQAELEQPDEQGAPQEELPRLVVLVRANGLQLEQELIAGEPAPRKEGGWFRHSELRALLEPRVSQGTGEGLLVVLDCPSELPTKYLTQCLGQLSRLDGITPVIR